MGFFDTDDGVEQYLEMVGDYDGRPLIEKLQTFVAPGATLLELGMGGGMDLDLLLDCGFAATGSDASAAFLRHYAARGGRAPTLQLDATTIETDLRFDVVYSNKVLQHLTRDALRVSFARQAEVLTERGRMFHTLWTGTGEAEHQGLLFTYHDRASLEAALPDGFVVEHYEVYDEMASEDSCLLVARRA